MGFNRMFLRPNGWIDQKRDARQVRHGLLQYLQSLSAQIDCHKREAGRIAAGVAQSFDKSVADGILRKHKHYGDRTGGPPSRRRTSKNGKEGPPSHSITSSASCCNCGGTLRPSALAVLRLMTSSYLTGLCIGRSPGLSPLRIRSMYATGCFMLVSTAMLYAIRPPRSAMTELPKIDGRRNRSASALMRSPCSVVNGSAITQSAPFGSLPIDIAAASMSWSSRTGRSSKVKP